MSQTAIKTNRGPVKRRVHAATQKIPCTHEIGLTWEDDQGNTCRTELGRVIQGKRVLTLSESSFVGVSFGARHFYATLRCHAPAWSVNGDDVCHGGYGGKRKPYMEGIRLDAERVLKIREKDGMGRSLGDPGETTYRFNSKSKARAAAIALFLERFGPGWVLVPDDLSGGEQVLAET